MTRPHPKGWGFCVYKLLLRLVCIKYIDTLCRQKCDFVLSTSSCAGYSYLHEEMEVAVFTQALLNVEKRAGNSNHCCKKKKGQRRGLVAQLEK